jgi:signal transduction histidine kinase
MPKGGRFTLSTQAWRLEPALLRGHPQRRLGDFVVLQVEDTGPGIPADALPHIFEPFYTHRALGRKTGLGLAIIHDIVEQHRGWIEVDNAPGQGARFRIHLPVWQDNPAAPAEAPRPAQADGGRNAGLLGG